jgi:hypothetical protein
MERVFRNLEAQRVKLYDLPDEDFTDAYLAFRRRVEETIKMYTKILNVGRIPIGDWIAKAGAWLADFFGGEGFDPIPREDGTYTLDPVPFQDMIRTIINRSQPHHQDSHQTKQYLNDFNKMKNFANGLIQVVAAYGVSPACVQKYLYKGVVNILDSIDLADEDKIVSISKDAYSIEVKKYGTVVIASYQYIFQGKIERGCCYNSQLVTMTLKVKVWKFPTVADLKDEYYNVQ